MKKRRVAREREKGGNPSRYYRRKYQKAVGQQIPLTFDIHHLDGNWRNDELDNLVALPKDLHNDLHKLMKDDGVIYSNGQFYGPVVKIWSKLLSRTPDNYRVLTEVSRWIEYRNHRLGRVPLNLTGFSYE